MKKHNAKVKRARKTATPSEIAKTAAGVGEPLPASYVEHGEDPERPSHPSNVETQPLRRVKTNFTGRQESSDAAEQKPLVAEVTEFADALPETPLTADEIKAHESPESLASSGDATP